MILANKTYKQILALQLFKYIIKFFLYLCNIQSQCNYFNNLISGIFVFINE